MSLIELIGRRRRWLRRDVAVPVTGRLIGLPGMFRWVDDPPHTGPATAQSQDQQNPTIEGSTSAKYRWTL